MNPGGDVAARNILVAASGGDALGGNPRADLEMIYHRAVEAVNGRDLVRSYFALHPPATTIRMVAIGKAAGAMALGACEALGDAVAAGLVITKPRHLPRGFPCGYPLVAVEAGHPVPDAHSLEAGRLLLEFIISAPQPSAFVFLISGGASALVEVAPEGIDLGDLQRAHRWLTASGLAIAAVNQVRARLSCIKGGRLAERLYGHRVLQLMISDVPGDDPAVIGSGLLNPGVTSLAGKDSLPSWLTDMLACAPPAPDAAAACFRAVETRVIATSMDARLGAASCAEELGYRLHLHPALITGGAVQAGQRMAELLHSGEPVMHIWSGETVVELPDAPGVGGRCQHLALAAAQVMAGRSGLYLLAAGTDGGDGPGPAAGALVDGGTIARGRGRGLDDRGCLRRADAGTFLAASGDLIYTGASGTNVMDLMLACKDGG